MFNEATEQLIENAVRCISSGGCKLDFISDSSNEDLSCSCCMSTSDAFDIAEMIFSYKKLWSDTYIREIECLQERLSAVVQKLNEKNGTVDVSPVIHAHWIQHAYGEYPICSNCKKYDTYAGDYCGNCGAKMDGKDDEQK